MDASTPLMIGKSRSGLPSPITSRKAPRSASLSPPKRGKVEILMFVVIGIVIVIGLLLTVVLTVKYFQKFGEDDTPTACGGMAPIPQASLPELFCATVLYSGLTSPRYFHSIIH
jgi:hypothetical protein